MLPFPLIVFGASVVTAFLGGSGARTEEFGASLRRAAKQRRRKLRNKYSSQAAEESEGQEEGGEEDQQEKGEEKREEQDPLDKALREIDLMFMTYDVGDEIADEMVDDEL